MERIPMSCPSISAREIELVGEALLGGLTEDSGPFYLQLEEHASAFFGRNYAIPLPSCASAVHLTLAALGIGPGDEVIIPDLAGIASSAPISYVGARPVFADVDPSNWCLSAETLQACLSKATRAVIVVDLYGNLPEIQPILDLAAEHEIAVIEDVTEAIGSSIGSRKAGSFGIASCVSLDKMDTLTAGQGGLLLTDDDRLYSRVQKLRRQDSKTLNTVFFGSEVGFDYRMSSLQAAVGVSQFERVDELIERKRQVISWYQEALDDAEGVSLNPEYPGTNFCGTVTAILDEGFGYRKHRVREDLLSRGIETRPFYYPLSSLPAFRDTFPGRRGQLHNKTSYEISPCGINLPTGPHLTQQAIERVCRELRSLIGQGRQRVAA